MRIVSEQDISKLGKHAQSQIRKHMDKSSSVSGKMPSPPAAKRIDGGLKSTSKKSKDIKHQTILELVNYVNIPANQKIF